VGIGSRRSLYFAILFTILKNYLFLSENFERIIDSHAIVRNTIERSNVPITEIPPVATYRTGIVPQPGW
jgi:hypothetical protein